MSTSGGVWKALQRGTSIGCEVVQIFVKNNMQWFGKPCSPQDLALYAKELAAVKIAPVFGHAGYLINLGAPNCDNRDKSLQALVPPPTPIPRPIPIVPPMPTDRSGAILSSSLTTEGFSVFIVFPFIWFSVVCYSHHTPVRRKEFRATGGRWLPHVDCGLQSGVVGRNGKSRPEGSR